MQDVLVAAKQREIGNIVATFPEFVVGGIVSSQEQIMAAVEDYTPDILLYIDGIQAATNTIDFLMAFRKMYPATRIIYYTGTIDESDYFVQNSLSRLIKLGITDIVTGNKMSKKKLHEVFVNGLDGSQLSFLKNNEMPQVEEEQGVFSEGFENVIVFSSIKPGTGKSFVAANVSMAIAKFGRKKKDGRPIKVGIIEGDLQTLSVGTLLKIEDKNYNLKSALEEVSTIIDDQGVVFGNEEDILRVREFVKRCFLPHSEIPNLLALTGSQLNFKDMGHINPYQYFFLVQLVVDEFDVIIVDSNSSLEHKTTGPILQMANTCFYVVDLDFINIRSNIRYRQDLERIGVMPKVRYIVNKYIDATLQEKYAETLEFGHNQLVANNFNIAGLIPMVDMSVILNRLHSGRPIIMDNTPATLDARIAISKIADQIWAMDNMVELRYEQDQLNNPAKKKKGLFGRNK